MWRRINERYLTIALFFQCLKNLETYETETKLLLVNIILNNILVSPETPGKNYPLQNEEEQKEEETKAQLSNK